MEIIDIIIAILLVIGLISGLRDGLVKQVAALVGLIAGLLIGKALYVPVGDWLMNALSLSDKVAYLTAFILILIIVPLLFSLVGWLVSKILHAICLGWLNRLLGGLIGVIKFAIFAGVIITAIELFDRTDTLISEEKKSASIFYYPLYRSSNIFFDTIKEELLDEMGNKDKGEVTKL